MDGAERRKIVMDCFTSNKFVINPNNIYKPRDSDIVCIGGPKSGTTWMQQILHQIRTKGDMSFDDIYAVTSFIPHPDDVFDLDVNKEQMWEPRIFKHHESYGIIPATNYQKQIFIARDPYDSVFSWSKFIDRFFGGDNDICDHDMGDLLDTLHNHNKLCNFKSTASWWQHRNDRNVLFLFYEDLVQDLNRMVKKISDFVEIPLTDHELATVVNNCTFDYIVKNKENLLEKQ